MRIAKPQGPNLKTPRYESEAYRRHVASKPCAACGAVVLTDEGFMSQCAHIGVGSFARGMKAPDYYTIPLCPPHGCSIGCHKMFDKNQRVFAPRLFGMAVGALKNQAFNAWLEWQINQIWKGQK